MKYDKELTEKKQWAVEPKILSVIFLLGVQDVKQRKGKKRQICDIGKTSVDRISKITVVSSIKIGARNNLYYFDRKHAVTNWIQWTKKYTQIKNYSNSKYRGLQALIKDGNEFADYILCFAYSLNFCWKICRRLLSGSINFLLYVSLSDDSSQWHMLRRISDTRWSARVDVTRLR